jgi:hypothetical protein
MANEAVSHAPIPFDDFARDLEGFFYRVVHKREEVLIENEQGEVAILKPAPVKKRVKRRRTVSDADYQAFLSSAGSWEGLVDTEKLKQDIRESRNLSSRPPIEL